MSTGNVKPAGALPARPLLGALVCLLLSGCTSEPTPKERDCSKFDSQCSRGVWQPGTGLCMVEFAPENQGCDDHDRCTLDDACRAGTCAGTPMDCTELEDECNRGVCDRGECLAEPRSDGTPCLSQTDECTRGTCQAGGCAGNPLPDGTACNDGDWCTEVDACADGSCIGTARDCDDGLDCTVDSCDPERFACDHAVAAGSCLVGGTCRAEGEPNPDNACQACLTGTSVSGWSNLDGASCSDGNDCTHPDLCEDGSCVGTPLPGCCTGPQDCDDGAICTEDVCEVSTGLCSNPVVPGSCLVGGTCHPDGTVNPANACQRCDSSVDATSWTNHADPCNDGQFCTSADMCSDGICQGVAGTVCDDGLACTQDTCDEIGNACAHTVDPGACSIGGVCFADGDPRPTNPCQTCDSSASQSDWTALPGGSPCDDGSFCNDGESCNNGVCEGGSPRDCDDGLACTTNSCNEAAGQCTVSVQAGWCAVDGGCYAEGAPDPANPCQECVSSVDPIGWTHDDSNSCDDGDWCTTADNCSGGTCQGSARSCDDGLACTEDSCDSAAGRCDHAVSAGSCLIAGVCRADGEPNPANPCQECISTSSQSGWSNDDTNACDDGNNCTGNDRCSAGSCIGDPLANCCTGPADCDDGKACTDNLCDVGTGTCSNPVLATWCLIGGTCYADSSVNPANPCEACDSSSDPADWSGRPDGTACDDGQFCTENDACSGGACAGGTPNACSDGLGCTDDTCDEGTDSCNHQLLSDRCLIAGTCYLDGEVNPASDCEACRVAIDPNTFSPRPDGAGCGGICQWCQAGICTDVPDAGNADPFGECPACLVCNGTGGCRPATDGTDPKNECTASGCSLDDCQAGTCHLAAGTQCNDPSPGNCRDAQCDGAGACVQDYAPEPGGDTHSCRPPDDVCDVEEFCDGVNLDCPPDAVQDASVECRSSTGECDGVENCDGFSKFCPADGFEPAGTPCSDATPGDCSDAQCDGFGACLQDHDIETPGSPCDDSDACTGPDLCDALGQCAGSPLNPVPSADSPVAATSACLTRSTSARSVLSLALRDGFNNPIPGATVTIEATSPAVSWAGPVVESTAEPGTYYRVMLAPGSGGSTDVTFSAATGSGPCASPTVVMNNPITIQFRDPAPAGTGGCSPIDNNLRVRVVDAATGAPLPGARVLVGSSQAAVFENDYEDVLAGNTPDLLNTGLTDAAGVAEFLDHGSFLEGPRMVTAGQNGRSYVTLVDANASDVVIPLASIAGPPPRSQIGGTLTGMGAVNLDGLLAAGLVLTEIGIESVAKFRFDDMLAAEADCWLATDHWIIGDTWVEMPVNIYLPDQTERYLFFNIPIYEHLYQTKPIADGTLGHRIVGISGTAPFTDVVGVITGGGSLADIVPLLDTERIGVITKDVNGDESGVPLPLNTALNPNVSCSIANKPAGSDSLCFTVGDWSGGTGEGSMFVMGFKALSGGTGTMTTVPAAGDFAGIGYVGMGVAAFLDSDSLPPGDEWKSNAASGILDRSGTSFDGTGGSLVFDDFLGITDLIRSNRTYSWNSVDTATPADYTEHDIDLVTFLTYTPGVNCNQVEEDTWRSTYWKILTPADTLTFTLPDLPPGWPRQADGGLVSPGPGERLAWSFAAFHLGLLSTFDFDAFDFQNALQSVTHSSTNFEDF